MKTVYLNKDSINIVKETSTSKIIFTDDYIFKVKKEVVLPPFIDYSTKRNRELSLLREYKKGKRYSPYLYKEIVLVSGEEIDNEPGICMLIGDKTRCTVFDYLISRKHTDFSAYHLLNTVKNLHSKSPSVTVDWKKNILNIGQRFSMLLKEAKLLNKKLEDGYIELIELYLNYYMKKEDERYKRACIRHLHGDLHTGNLLYENNNFIIFDFLDFDDSYCIGDYLQDVGFLLADIYIFGMLELTDMGIMNVANWIEDDPCFIALFSSYGALNKGNILEYEKNSMADDYYNLAYSLLKEGEGLFQKNENT